MTKSAENERSGRTFDGGSAAFWDLRKDLSNRLRNGSCLRARKATAAETRKNSPLDFVSRVIATDVALNDGRNRAQIERVFRQHGVAVAAH
jgi:hypothetical protein